MSRGGAGGGGQCPRVSSEKHLPAFRHKEVLGATVLQEGHGDQRLGWGQGEWTHEKHFGDAHLTALGDRNGGPEHLWPATAPPFTNLCSLLILLFFLVHLKKNHH